MRRSISALRAGHTVCAADDKAGGSVGLSKSAREERPHPTGAAAAGRRARARAAGRPGVLAVLLDAADSRDHLPGLAAGGRRGSYWATACVLMGWGLAVVYVGATKPTDIDPAGAYLVGAGLGAVAGTLLAGGTSTSAPSASAPPRPPPASSSPSHRAPPTCYTRLAPSRS